jgi:hypothetical protein
MTTVFEQLGFILLSFKASAEAEMILNERNVSPAVHVINTCYRKHESTTDNTVSSVNTFDNLIANK